MTDSLLTAPESAAALKLFRILVFSLNPCKAWPSGHVNDGEAEARQRVFQVVAKLPPGGGTGAEPPAPPPLGLVATPKGQKKGCSPPFQKAKRVF